MFLFFWLVFMWEIILLLFIWLIWPGKCRFWKICPDYDLDNDACRKNLAENYYGIGRPAGCYRKMQEQKV